jgi:Primase C terminal 1 (PriCT-1)
LLNDTQSRYGESPFIVETRGGYHAYYRYGGEGRHIKPWRRDTDRPPLRVILDELRKPIPSGKRNTTLFHIGLQQAEHTDDFETLLDVMRTRNMDCEIPLPDSEVIKAAESVWKYQIEGRNLVGKGRSPKSAQPL